MAQDRANEQDIITADPVQAASTSAQSKTTLSEERMLLGSGLKWLVPFLGGLGLMVHFWRIGYAPSLSLGDLGTVLGAFVLFSTYALLLILVLILMPAALLGYWVEHHILPPPGKASRANPSRRTLKSLRRKADIEKAELIDHQPRSAGRARIFRDPATNASFMLWELPLAALLALSAYALLVNHFNNCHGIARYGLWILFGLGMLVSAFSFSFPDWHFVRQRIPSLRRKLIRYSLLFALYLAFWPILLVLLMGTVPNALDEAGWPYLLMTVALILTLHVSIYAAYRKPSRVRLATAAGGLLMVLLYSQVLFAIVDSAVASFGLGMMRNVELIVSKRGCEIANAAWPGHACAKAPVGTGAYRLGKMDVFTRIGPDFLLSPPGGLTNPAKPRFTLPAKEVLSWSRPPKTRPPASQCDE